ncbi:MAG: type II toxin-antitoxin system PemK/MazF family toxin [Promethearchaeota archaeon]
MNAKIKEIWYLDLNPTIGHEQSGERPAIVVSRAHKLKMIMVIPLTGNLKQARFPYTLQIKNNTNNGLVQDSVALVYQLRAVSTNRIRRKVGIIDSSVFNHLKTLMRNYLHL